MSKINSVETDSKELITCYMCGKKHPANYHYQSFDLFNKIGRLPYCKECLKSLCKDENGNIKKENFIKMLKIINRPFLFEIYNKSVLDLNDTIGVYFKNIALPQNRKLTFNDSIFELGLDIEEPENNNTSTELIHKWGSLPHSSIEYLETEYQDWCKRYDVSSKAMEVNVKEICYQQLVIKTKREANEPVEKELKSLSELMGNSALKPIQESAAMSAEANTLGTWIKKIEEEEPFPEVDDTLKDVDGFSKYIRIWFLGHLCKILGIDNDYSEEYEEEMLKYTVDLSNEDSRKDGES